MTIKTPGGFRPHILSLYGTERLRGRGIRGFQASEIDRNGDPIGLCVVLKDTWTDSDSTREGNVLALLRAAANDEDRQLIEKHFFTIICHRDVLTDVDILDNTANGLMRRLNMASGHVSAFNLMPFVDYEPRFGSKSRSRYTTHRTHYRIVFKEKGITIGLVRGLPDVMTVLSETVSSVF